MCNCTRVYIVHCSFSRIFYFVIDCYKYILYNNQNMSGFDINEASNYFVRYPTAQGPTTLQNTTVSGNLSITGNTSITSTTESTSLTTGAFIVSGGVGIAKDLYVGGNIRHDVNAGQTMYTRNVRIADTNGVVPAAGEGVGDETYIYGNTWVFENKAGSGTIRFDTKNADGLDTKAMNISYDKVAIEQFTASTSKTTGALTVVGGISTQNNIYAGGNIVASGASSTVSMYSTTPQGASVSSKTGIILTNTYPGGVVNENDTAVSFGINTKQFGLRDTSRAGAMVRMDIAGTNPAFSVLGQPAGSGASEDPTPYFTVDANGNAVVYSTSASTTTTSGALQVAGGMGIAGNVNVGDIIKVWDGVNSGIIDQSGTTMRFVAGNIAMTGNVQIAGNISTTGTLTVSNLLFTDGTTQSSSISNSDILSDCDFHSFVYNQANPSTPKTFISASYSLSQTPGTTTAALTANNMYFWPVYLIAGQTVNGVAFWVSAAVSASVAIFRGYDGATTYSNRKTITASNITTANNTMTYAPVNSWTVDWTGIHYVCILPFTGVNIVSTPSNSYGNFNITSNLTGGTLSRMGGTVAGSSIPTSTSGLTITTLTYTAYVGVYM